MNNIVVVDTETTGPDPHECHIVEIGMLKLDECLKAVNSLNFQVKPPIAIPYEAMAVHDITNKDVQDCPAIADIRPHLEEMLSDAAVLAAHHSRYDMTLIDRELPGLLDPFRETSSNSLCTMRLAKHLLPGLPSYALQVLKYRLGLWGSDKHNSSRFLNEGGAHSALYDCHVTADLLRYGVREFISKLPTHPVQPGHETTFDCVQRCAELSHRPIMIQICPFNKHKGELFTDVVQSDPGYMQWLSKEVTAGKFDDDPDMVYTIRHLVKGIFIERNRR